MHIKLLFQEVWMAKAAKIRGEVVMGLVMTKMSSILAVAAVPMVNTTAAERTIPQNVKEVEDLWETRVEVGNLVEAPDLAVENKAKRLPMAVILAVAKEVGISLQVDLIIMDPDRIQENQAE